MILYGEWGHARSSPLIATADEVIPMSLGGRRHWGNQVAACAGCNSARSSMDAHEFYYHRQTIMDVFPPGTYLTKHSRVNEIRRNREAVIIYPADHQPFKAALGDIATIKKR